MGVSYSNMGASFSKEESVGPSRATFAEKASSYLSFQLADNEKRGTMSCASVEPEEEENPHDTGPESPPPGRGQVGGFRRRESEAVQHKRRNLVGGRGRDKNGLEKREKKEDPVNLRKNQ